MRNVKGTSRGPLHHSVEVCYCAQVKNSHRSEDWYIILRTNEGANNEMSKRVNEVL